MMHGIVKSRRILHILGHGKLRPNPDEVPVSGVVRAVLEMAKAQAEMGHRVHVVGISEATWIQSWCGVTLAGCKPVRFAMIRVGGRSIDLRQHIAFALYTVLNRFDVVDGHFFPYLRLIRACVRVIHAHSDPYFSGTTDWDVSWKPSDFNVAAKYSTCTVCVSPFVERHMREGFAIVPAYPVHRVENGVDLARFSREAHTQVRSDIRAGWGIDDAQFVFLFSGAITPEKGLRELAQAFLVVAAQVSDAVLVIVGSSHLWGTARKGMTGMSMYEAEIRAMLQPWVERGRVVFAGMIPSGQMAAVLVAGDVVVMPTVPRLSQEAFGLTALEAMAASRPVVVSRSGNLPQLVTNRGGWIVEESDAEAFAAELLRITNARDEVQAKGLAARRLAEQYAWEQAASRLCDVYERHL